LKQINRPLKSQAPQSKLELERERACAIQGLLDEGCYFKPKIDQGIGNAGLYDIEISLIENRIHMKISEESANVSDVQISLQSLRSLIKDYTLINESYHEAVKEANFAKLEAIDMGRRGLHNEAAETLKELLSESVETDIETARKIFTLIYVLHMKEF
jgi:uncharacterized protein (UPF0262 family)